MVKLSKILFSSADHENEEKETYLWEENNPMYLACSSDWANSWLEEEFRRRENYMGIRVKNLGSNVKLTTF